MRYLIFNITVLVALGYLFTGAPNQSFTQWMTSTLDDWSNTPTDKAIIDGDSVTETGTVFAKAVAKAASESLEAIDDKILQPPEPEASPPKRQVSMDADEIKQLVITAMKEAEAERIISSSRKISKTTPSPEMSEVSKLETHTKNAPVNQIQTALPLLETSKTQGRRVQEQPVKAPKVMSDAEIAAAFSAFEKIEDENSEKTEKFTLQQEKSSRFIEQKPKFMSPKQRVDDVSRIIQQLNILHLENTGI